MGFKACNDFYDDLVCVTFENLTFHEIQVLIDSSFSNRLLKANLNQSIPPSLIDCFMTDYKESIP